jgi:hypothetical protein
MTLAEKLRALVESKKAWKDAEQTLVGTPAEMWDDRDCTLYLRGYDDAQAEIDALTARVRELEAQPAAVGVAGAVRWGRMYGDSTRYPNCMMMHTSTNRADAEKYIEVDFRVVAIVDPAQIVPLASAEPVRWRTDGYESTWAERKTAAGYTLTTVTPLYPGLAQPAQEGDG